MTFGEDNFKDCHGLDFSFVDGIVTYLSLVPNFAAAEGANFARLLAIWQVNRDKFFENFSRGNLRNKQISNNAIKLLSPWSAMSDLS